MMRLILISILLASQALAFSQAPNHITVEGGIAIGTKAFNNPPAGTIVWNGLKLLGYDGNAWIPLTGFSLNRIVADMDGNEYPTVIVGQLEWTTKNLKSVTFQNTQTIPEVTDPTDWANTTDPAWCWYNNDSSLDEFYGKLYNWHAARDTGFICPDGFRVPTQNDWQNLINQIGSEAAKVKAKDALWDPPANNSTGFTAVPAGLRNGDTGQFENFQIANGLWSITQNESLESIFYELSVNFLALSENTTQRQTGMSIRCVRNIN